MWFESLGKFFKNIGKTEVKELEATTRDSKETAKERLHMVLMQDRANVSADFLELMKQEIIEVIKKYIEVDEKTIDVRLTTQTNEDGSINPPSLYANIPILNIRNDMKVENYKFALQSDGSIIAQKIEEDIKEEDFNANSISFKEEEKIDDDSANSEENDKIDEKEKIIDLNSGETEVISNENNETLSDKIENNSSISEKMEINEEENDKISDSQNIQNDLIKEIIPVIENIDKINNNDDFDNKKNDEVEKKEEDAENKITDSVIHLKKSAKRGRPKKKSKKDNKKENENVIESNSSENYDDEIDDDVTFDDLLKAAEEEDRKKAEQEKKEVE